MPAMSMASTVCSQLSTWARISASAVTVAVFMGMLLSTTGWRRLRRPAHRGAGAHGATCTIHDTPKRSATIPTRGAKKTVVNGICTCPPSASAANSRAASAWSGTVREHLCRERDRLLATAIEAQRGLDVQSLSWSMVRDIASTDQSNDGQQLLRGIDGTWASVRRRHRLGSPGRRGRGMVDRVCTRGTVRCLRQALEGFGCAASQESQQRELVGDRVRHHDRAPSSWCDGGHWTRFGGREHDPRAAGTRPDSSFFLTTVRLCSIYSVPLRCDLRRHHTPSRGEIMADVLQCHTVGGPTRVRAGLFPVKPRKDAQRGTLALVDRGRHPLFSGGLVRRPTPRNSLMCHAEGDACA